jgi:type II secretory pathway predicted ATPase ExeA
MTAITILLQAERDELTALASRIRAWQEARKTTTADMLRRFPGLGSDKTYGRMLKGDLDETDIERQLASYRAVAALIESISGREGQEEEMYKDLTPVLLLRRALLDILEEKSVARVILLEGDSGCGKSTALTLLQRDYGQRLLVIEAAVAWNDKPMALMGSILDAMGVRDSDQPKATAPRLAAVVSRLRETRTAIAIDEAHGLGPKTLDTLKTLINQTPSEVILLAWPSLWRKLESAAWAEVKQLLGNRLAERIRLGGLRETDVKKLLERRLGENAVDAGVVREVLASARTRGNLQFVRQVCRRAREGMKKGDVLEPSDVIAAVDAQKRRRGDLEEQGGRA